MIRVPKHCMLFFTAVAILLLASCTNKVSDSNLKEGSLADPAYREATGAMEASMDNTQSSLFDGIGLYWEYTYGTPFAASFNSDTIIYTYENGWHHLIRDYVDDTTGSTYFVDDSVQIKDTLGAAQQYPDTNNIGSIEVRIKRYVYVATYDTTEDFQFKGDDTVLARMLMVVNDTVDVTINGAATDHAHGTFLHPDSVGVECSLDGKLNHAVNNLIIPFKPNPGECITSGQLAASGSVNIVCPFAADTVTVSGSWRLVVNIGTNFVTFIAQNNTTRWIKTIPKSEFCSGSPVVAFQGLPGRFQE